MNGILLVSSFCDVCSAVSRSISWARCLPLVTAESGVATFFEKLAHFLALPGEVGFGLNKVSELGLLTGRWLKKNI